MSWILRCIILILMFSGAAGYGLYKIYKTYLVFPVIFILSFLPIGLFILGRKSKSPFLDIVTGHYLFYLNCILGALAVLLFLDGVLKIFSISFLDEISLRKREFHFIFLSFIALTAFYGNYNFKKIKTVGKEIPVTKYSEIGNLKFAFISDIHLNEKFDGSVLRKALQRMKERNIELLLIGGDFLDNSHTSVKDDIKKILKEYPFKNGIYMVLGNHEYYGGIEENIKYLEGLGINILRDQRIEVEGVTIIGRDDSHNRYRRTVEDLMAGVDRKKPIILMEHNPLYIEESTGKDIDLYLAGHTHNGQLIPFNLIVKNMYKNPAGYKDISGLHSYVSTGLGTWMIPYRIGSQSELVIFNLDFNKEKRGR